uniref:Uncharacterized protein n=2 Tax=Caenorhabditis japonica TaxID=281687 RepID=A0A8R1IWF9_CAEJA
MLPGGKSIQLTRLITNSLVSNWIGKPIERAMEIAILEILVEVKKRDPCFLLYSAAQSYKTKYPRIEDRFFENFATVLHAGFGLGNGTEPNDWEYQKTIFMMKDITQKFLNKLFRARELGIQDEEMHTDTGVQEDEGPSVTEPNMDDI